MKRRLALILITLTLPGLLMADGWIGGKLGVGISTYDKDIKYYDNTVTNVTGSDISIDITGGGEHYFSNVFGLGYELGLDYPVARKTGDGGYSWPEVRNMSLSGALTAQFRWKISDSFQLAAGAGASLELESTGIDIGGGAIKADSCQVAIRANLSMGFNVAQSVRLTLGSDFDVPVYTYSKVTQGGHLNQEITDYKGFIATPYIAVAYTY